MPVVYEPPEQPAVPVEEPVLTDGSGQPHHLPDPQNWAIDQERMRHDQALYEFGEYVFFILMWNEIDLKAGRVARCTRCFGGTIVDERVAAVYKQPVESSCPECWGTTFEGGYKARIVRPSLWDFSEDRDSNGRRGFTVNATGAIQSTSDFQMRSGDHVVRGDGTRWMVQSLSAPHLRTGFQTPTNIGNTVAFNYGNAVKEDPSATVFLMPPALTPSQLFAILNPAHPHYPVDFSDQEDIRGPLMALYD